MPSGMSSQASNSSSISASMRGWRGMTYSKLTKSGIQVFASRRISKSPLPVWATCWAREEVRVGSLDGLDHGSVLLLKLGRVELDRTGDEGACLREDAQSHAIKPRGFLLRYGGRRRESGAGREK